MMKKQVVPVETLPSIPKRHLREIFRHQRGAALQKYFVYFKKSQRIWGGKGPQGAAGAWMGRSPYECRGEGFLPRPCFIHIYPMLPLLPPSVGETDAALGTTASQNLAAVGSGHALTETMDLGAMTLLGLIGTNHAETPPVQIGKAQSPYGGLCRPPQHPVWDAVGKINALNSAHEIIPKSTPSVKKNSNLFSQELGNTRCCVGIFSF